MRYCCLLVPAFMLVACSSLPSAPPAALCHCQRARIVVPSIPCSLDPAIAYHVPKKGQEEDRANAYDTPETAAVIDKHNAARKAVCP